MHRHAKMAPALLSLLGRIPWRYVGIGFFLLMIFAAGWRVGHKPVRELQGKLRAEMSCAQGSACFERATALQNAQEKQALIAAKVSADVVASYESEIESLRNKPPRVRVVRVCRDEAVAGAVRGESTARAADAGAAGDRRIPAQAGPDIGPELYDLAGDCDKISAQLRALQIWAKELSAER